ncbi:MAG: lipocalin-like domain-containing protein [Gammaproteobacteria bacterium]
MLNRRQLLMTAALRLPPVALIYPGAAHPGVTYPGVVPRPLVFPADYGAHPEFRTEWWYLTGWLEDIGFQVTFFRVRTDVDPANPSAFAARQLVIAHAAIADPARGRLLTDERIARAGFGLVGAASGDTDVRLDGWSLRRDVATDSYVARIAARGFTLHFRAVASGTPWLQGNAGVSRKGPLASQASYYYSRPQLAVEAEVTTSGSPRRLTGSAWLDQEWSSAALAPDAAGWDWIGMNLDDGGALLAFQIRRQGAASDEPPLQRYAAFRSADGATRVVDPATVRFTPLETWTSARSGASWPVAQRIEAGGRSFETRPLMPDQELDSRLTTGAVYWEGASTLLESGKVAGRGYLEMTGYVTPLKL